jgi:hypothetical protein
MSTQLFESLEKRTMMAASVNAGLLTVTGTGGADAISIGQLANGNVQVNDNGAVTTFASANVNRIRVNARGGNDSVTVFLSVTRPATLNGGAGNDSLTGSNRSDSLNGSSGNDFLNGRGGADVLQGGSGTDSVRGGDGNDRLYAGTGSGRDSLSGQAGTDILVSLGGGRDNVSGGAGTDIFWVDKAIGIDLLGGTPADSTDATNSERNQGLLHEIETFQQLKRVNVPIVDEQTQTPSRELNSQNLLDPNPVSILNSATNNAVYTDFSDRQLFTTGNPTRNDVNQGGVGDCYFQAAIAAIANVSPSFLKRHVVDLGDGTYAVRFKNIFNGDEYVRVDAELPTVNGGLVYGQFGDNGTMWAAIMEKAWAFRRFNTGRYDTTTAGNSAEVFASLGLQLTNVQLSAFGTTAMMNQIRTDLAEGKMAVASSQQFGTPEDSPILAQHAYMIDRVFTNASGAVTSVRVFNPHGFDNTNDGSTDGNANDGLITLTPAEFMAAFIGYTAARV